MHLKSLIKDIPQKDNLNLGDVLEAVNYFLSQVTELPENEVIDTGDWIIHKVGKSTLSLDKKYPHPDMSRFLHDDFGKRRFVKILDKM